MAGSQLDWMHELKACLTGKEISWVIAGGSLLSLVLGDEPRDYDLFVPGGIQRTAAILSEFFQNPPTPKGSHVIRIGRFEIIEFKSATNISKVLGSFDLNVCMLGWKGEFEGEDPLIHVGEPLWEALDSHEIRLNRYVPIQEWRLMRRLGKYVSRTGWRPEEELERRFRSWYEAGMPFSHREEFLIPEGQPVKTVSVVLSELKTVLTRRHDLHHILELVHGEP